MKNWTVNAMEILQKAQGKAYEMSHAELTPLHLLWALLSETGLATQTLKTLELDPGLVARTAENELQSMPQVQVKEVPNPSNELQKLFLEATSQAGQGGLVGTRELLLALADDKGRAGSVLKTYEVTGKKIAMALKQNGSDAQYTGQDENDLGTNEDSALEKFATDLCAAARDGKIDPIIGRDEEIRRVI